MYHRKQIDVSFAEFPMISFAPLSSAILNTFLIFGMNEMLIGIQFSWQSQRSEGFNFICMIEYRISDPQNIWRLEKFKMHPVLRSTYITSGVYKLVVYFDPCNYFIILRLTQIQCSSASESYLMSNLLWKECHLNHFGSSSSVSLNRRSTWCWCKQNNKVSILRYVDCQYN